MVKTKAIGGIVAGIVIITITVFLISGQNQDIDIENSINNSSPDSPISVSDSATLTKNNPDFTIDEQGNKNYVISATDSPNFGD